MSVHPAEAGSATFLRLADERDRARDAAVALEQENAALTAALDRVRALADFWEGTCDPEFPPGNLLDACFATDQIRAVLAGGHAAPGGVRLAIDSQGGAA